MKYPLFVCIIGWICAFEDVRLMKFNELRCIVFGITSLLVALILQCDAMAIQNL